MAPKCSPISRLCPNESADTDVILLGHSMGGILSAEIALLPSILSSRSSAQGFRHCILGTMSFDCPFLGMHPGIVFSGIESLFRSAPTSPEISKSYPYQAWGSSQNDRSQATSPSMATLNLSSSGLESYPNSSASLIGSESQAAEAFEGNKSQESIRADSYSWSPDPDPNYNPPFPNDIRLPQRKGWDNALHFLTKHSQDLTHAAKAYVTSHLEFGVCVADYKGLKNRYTNLRPLEEANSPHNHGRRIRFVNYYTTCTGRPKRLKPVSRNEVGPYSYLGDARLSSGQTPRHHLDNMQNLGVHVPTTEPYNSGPRISVEEYRDGEMHSRETEDADATKPSREATSNVEERNVTSEVDSAGNSTDRSASIQSLLEPLSDVEPSVSNPAEIDPGRPLPQLPDFPGQPPRYDPASFFDGGSRNLAHKQYSADFKAYMRVLKAYDKAINNRQHLLEKQDKFKDKTKKRSKFQETTKASPSTVSTTSSKNAESVATSIISAKSPEEESLHALSETPCEKTKKERRFCVLPPQINGQTDPCWVQVFMKDVDQVGAHCGLFVPGDHYGWLVKDVVARIKAWVEEK